MSTLWIRIVDANFEPITDATLHAAGAENKEIDLRWEEDHWVGEATPGDRVIIHASAKGFEPETHAIIARDEITQVVIGLRKTGQLSYTLGNDRLAFAPQEDTFLIRASGAKAVELFSNIARKQKLKWRPVSPTAASSSDDLFAHVDRCRLCRPCRRAAAKP